MNLPDDITVSEARGVVDVIVATAEAMMLEHAEVPASVTFAALALAASNAIRARRQQPLAAMPTGRPMLRVVQ